MQFPLYNRKLWAGRFRVMALALTNPGADPRVHFKATGIEEKNRES